MPTIPFTADLTKTSFGIVAELMGDHRQFECTCEAEVHMGETVIVTDVFAGAFRMTKSTDRHARDLAIEIAAQAENDDAFCRSVREIEGVVYRGSGYGDPNGQMVRTADPDREREFRMARDAA